MAKTLDVARFSARFRVRRMEPGDAEKMLALCNTNPQYFEHCGTPATREGILRDLTLCPPGKDAADKYYVGYYDGARLAALLDLVAGYPDPDTAYIGLFMVDGTRAGRGLGTSLMEELFAALKAVGFGAVRLGYEKDNPQASRFWQKNGLIAQREAAHAYGTMVVARRAL